MATIIKNRKAYDSGDVVALINGIPIDIDEISYSKKQEKQNNYTVGSNKPTSWSNGKIEYEGSMTIKMHNFNIIENNLKCDLLEAHPFTINVTYLNSYNKVINDTIIAQFKSQGREVKGDMGLGYQYDLHIIDIEFNNFF